MSHWIGKLTDKESSKWASRTLSTVCLTFKLTAHEIHQPNLYYFCNTFVAFCILFLQQIKNIKKSIEIERRKFTCFSIHKYICYMHFYKNAFKRINCINLCKPSIEEKEIKC